MKRLSLALLALTLSGCIQQPPRYHYIQQRQTLLFGSDSAIMQGCERGVIRWHIQTTGQYLDAEGLRQVTELCTGVQFSFRERMMENGET